MIFLIPSLIFYAVWMTIKFLQCWNDLDTSLSLLESTRDKILNGDDVKIKDEDINKFIKRMRKES
jgi:hypothetical protein